MKNLNVIPFNPSIKDEATNESIVTEIIRHKPEGVKQLIHSRSTERELGPAKDAQSELDDLKVLLETQFVQPESGVSKKIEEYLITWADKYNPEIKNEKVLVSLDQRELADVFSRTHLVWENLTDDAKEAAAILATKAVTLEIGSQETRKDKDKDNILAYSNLTAITACAVLKKTESQEATALFDKFLKNFSEHVGESTQEDGSVFDFYNRDSLHYQMFNQLAWEKTLSFLDYLDAEVPSDTRDLVLKAREFCIQNIESDKVHLEFVHSENENDKALPNYGKPFDKKSYVCKQLLAQISR